MTKILFICHVNICRSPMAEMVFKHMARQRHVDHLFHVDSVATSTEELGCGIHPGTRRKLAEAGIPCGQHYAVQITKADYDKYDYLIIMDSRNARELKRIIPNDPERKVHTLLDFSERLGESIADPWYTGNFDDTFRDVVEGCEHFLNYLLENM